MIKRILEALIINLITIVLVMVDFYYTKPDPGVLIYSFVMVCILRYALIEFFYNLYKWNSSQTLRSLLTGAVKPFPEDKYPQYVQGFPHAIVYIILILIMFLFPFLFMHLESGNFVFSWHLFMHQIKSALIITIIYGLKDLLFKGLYMDFSKPKEHNFYYNSNYLLILWALAFVGGWLLPYGEIIGTPWLLIGILLAVKFIIDFASDVFYKEAKVP